MQDNISKNKSTSKKITHRAWFWILIGFVLLVAVFFSTLPVGIDHGIERYLKDQGADRVSLEDVDFNPITGHMTLTNLNVILDAQTVFIIPQATLDVEWRPFFSKRFVLKRLFITDSQLTVQAFEDDRWRIGGIMLPQKKEAAKPSVWNFGLQQVTVNNSIIKFISPQLTSELKIKQATISKLSSWLPEQSTRLEFKGQLNDGNLELQVDVTPFANEIVTAGRMNLKGLSLVPFARLLQPHLKTLEGHIDADLEFKTRRTPEEKLIINADGTLNGSKLSTTINNANIQIQQDDIDWQGKIDYDKTAGSTVLNLNGALKVDNANVTGPDVNLSENTLSWNGGLTYANSNSDAGLTISSDGKLSSGPLEVGLRQQRINFEKAGLEWQGKFDYATKKSNKNIDADGQLDLVDIKMESPEVNFVEEKLTWKGSLQLSSTAEPAGQRITADGVLNDNHLLVNLPQRKLKFEHHGSSWKGSLDSDNTNNFSALKAKADIVLNDIQILYSETNRRLLKAEQVALQAIQVEGLEKINVSGIVLNGLALLADNETGSPAADPPPLRVQKVKFDDVRLSAQKNLAIDTIQLEALRAFLHRDPEGKWPAVESWHTIQKDIFAADQADRATVDAVAKEKSDAFKFRIGQVDMSGNNEMQIKDESVQPAFGIDLKILEARLADLDSSRPQQPASVKLRVSDTESASLSLDGTLQPFADQLNLDWVGKIEAVELPPLSPYVIRSTGYRFTSGELEADVPLKIDRNQLKGEIGLILFNPKIKRAESEISGKERRGKIQLNMTLDSALRLLRDKQNNVKLKIPISGNINDPQFSVADAVNKVLARTLQTAAISYLKYALGPYGIGISVAQLAYEQALKIRLNPIEFAPGSAELNEAAIDYLKRVAVIMKEYPAVKGVVCGIATESDRTALGGGLPMETQNQSGTQRGITEDENKTHNQKEVSGSTVTDDSLLQLAKNRSERIEDQLTKLHEIAAKRMISCKPEIDSSAKAKPRADLEI